EVSDSGGRGGGDVKSGNPAKAAEKGVGAVGDGGLYPVGRAVAGYSRWSGGVRRHLHRLRSIVDKAILLGIGTANLQRTGWRRYVRVAPRCSAVAPSPANATRRRAARRGPRSRSQSSGIRRSLRLVPRVIPQADIDGEAERGKHQRQIEDDQQASLP